MEETETEATAPAGAANPAGAHRVRDTEGGRASWEEPHLPLRERLQRHWRQMLVHLWGPIGSLVFHVVAIGVLVTFATGNNVTEITSEPVVIEAKAQPELEKPPEPEKTKPPEPDPTVTETPTETTGIGFSTVESADIGGSGTQETGIGLGTGDPNLPDKGFEIATTVKSRLVMKGLYAGRTAGGRKGALGLYGKGGAGGAATEAAVLRALRWLKKNQESDGTWPKVKPAMTSFALLAYLAHGETPQSPEFGPTVKKAIDFLIADLKADGTFAHRDGGDYTAPIAAYALCEAYGLTQHPSIKDAAIKAINRVVKGQNAAGGFDYQLNPGSARSDSSVMGWSCQALKAAKMAGLESDVPGLEAAIKKGIAGFKMNYIASGSFGYDGPGVHGLAATGALCLQLLGTPKAVEVKTTMKFLEGCTFSFANWQKQPYNEEFPIYHWYYITQAKFHESPETFAAWNKQFSPELCKEQIVEKNAIEGPDGKMVDIGHWDSPSKGEQTRLGGQVEDTCLCTLMLEVYYRYLPSFKKIEAGPDDAAAVAPKAEDVAVKIK